MAVSRRKKAQELVLVLMGAFTESDHKTLAHYLESLSGGNFERIVLNLASVTYFSRPYIEKLVEFHQKMLAEGRTIVIQRASAEVQKQLSSLPIDPPLFISL